MSNLNENQERAIEQAESEGLTVVHGGPKLLLVDLDDSHALMYFEEHLTRIANALSVRDIELKEISRWKSKSGRGLHIKMSLSKPLNLSTRLLLQACLGSDRLREFLSLMRKWDGSPEPSLLFKPPQSGGVKKAAKKSPLRDELLQTWLDDDVPF